MAEFESGKPSSLNIGDLQTAGSPFNLGSTLFGEKDPLRDSIQRYGILSPIAVRKADGAYQLAHGFRRVEAAADLGLERVPARVSDSASPAELLRKSLSENRATRPVTLYEKTMAFKILEGFGAPQTDMIQRDLPLMGFPAQAKIFRILRRLQDMPRPLLRYLSERNCPLRRLAPFLDLDERSQTLWVEIVERLKPGLNDLEFMTRNLAETARREGRKTHELLKETGMEKFLRTLETPPQEPAQTWASLSGLILEKRYPELSRHREKIRALLKTLRLPPYAKIRWDETLEKPGITLQIDVKKETELLDALKFLSGDGRRTALKNLLNELE